MAFLPSPRLALIRRCSYTIPALLAASVLAATLPAQLRAQVKVLPLGDSITQGKDTTYPGYREELWHLLTDAGYDVDFVGTLTKHYDSDEVATGYDSDHEGHGGWRADDILNGHPDADPKTGGQRLSDWLLSYTPDVALILLGTNDLNHESRNNPNRDEEVVDRTREELSQIIDVLRSDNSKVTVLLGQLIPAHPDSAKYSNRHRRIPLLNEEILTLAAEKNSDDSRVVVVDHFTGFDPAVHTFDGLHANRAGGRLMAQRWFEALQTVIEPAPPNEPPVASFTAEPVSGISPLEVIFDASGSTDTDGTIASYAWDFGDGAKASGRTSSHTYESSGAYTVILTVTDDEGAQSTSSQEILVRTNSSPEPFALMSPADKSIEHTPRPAFLWQVSEDPDAADLILYKLYMSQDSLFGSVSPVEVNTNAYVSTVSLEENKRYWWRVEAVDRNGLSTPSSTWSFWIDAKPEPPQAVILIAPRDNEEITTPTPTFTWSQASEDDPNDEPVYLLRIATDREFKSEIQAMEVGADTSATVTGTLADAQTYYWRVDAIDQDSLITQSSVAAFTIMTGTGTEEPIPPDFPETYVLEQNYPNPFSSQSTIRFGLPAPAHVVLAVYDVTGRLVASLIQQQMPSGWHEATLDARDLPNGLYIYYLRADSYAASGKMLVIR